MAFNAIAMATSNINMQMTSLQMKINHQTKCGPKVRGCMVIHDIQFIIVN